MPGLRAAYETASRAPFAQGVGKRQAAPDVAAPDLYRSVRAECDSVHYLRMNAFLTQRLPMSSR